MGLEPNIMTKTLKYFRVFDRDIRPPMDNFTKTVFSKTYFNCIFDFKPYICLGLCFECYICIRMWSQWDGCWGTRPDRDIPGILSRYLRPQLSEYSHFICQIFWLHQDLQLTQKFHSHDFNQKDLKCFLSWLFFAFWWWSWLYSFHYYFC